MPSGLRLVRSDRVLLSVDIEGSVLLDGERCWSSGDDAALMRTLNDLVTTESRHLVVTPNVDQVLNLEDVGDFRRVFKLAALRLLDGMPLVLLARSLGARNARRRTGADLLPLVVQSAATFGWRVTLAGGDYSASAEAAGRLNAAAGVEVVSVVEVPKLSSVHDADSAGVAKAIEAQNPSVVFLGLGSPKQELWFEHWADCLPPAVYIGSGAAADFISGRVRRAPRWMQAVGAEWFWRLIQEPRRLFVRYLIRGPRFLSVICRSHLAAVRRRNGRWSRYE